MTSEEINPFGIDGYVCMWTNWNILSIKCPMYLKLIRMLLEGTFLSKFWYPIFQKTTIYLMFRVFNKISASMLQ